MGRGFFPCAVFLSQLLLGASAYAADLTVSTYDWSGPYLGLEVGNGWGSKNNTVNSAFQAKFSDFIGGAHLGWNHQSDKIVWGVEGDLNYSDLKAHITASNGDKAFLDTNIIGSLRARVGIAANNLLFYGTGGLAFADADYKIGTGGLSEKFSDTPIGFTVGAGTEMGFTEKISGRIEYRYTDLGSTVFRSTLFPIDTFTAHYKFHTVRAGVTWHF